MFLLYHSTKYSFYLIYPVWFARPYGLGLDASVIYIPWMALNSNKENTMLNPTKDFTQSEVEKYKPAEQLAYYKARSAHLASLPDKHTVIDVVTYTKATDEGGAVVDCLPFSLITVVETVEVLKRKLHDAEISPTGRSTSYISTVQSIERLWRKNSKTGEVGKTAFNSSRNHKGQHVERWETHGEKQLRLPKWQGRRQDAIRVQPKVEDEAIKAA